MDLVKLNYEYNKLKSFASAYEQRRSFAVDHFDDLLSFARELKSELKDTQSTKDKTSIADNYPVGEHFHEPCGNCLDLLSVLEEIAKLPKDADISRAKEMAEKVI